MLVKSTLNFQFLNIDLVDQFYFFNISNFDNTEYETAHFQFVVYQQIKYWKRKFKNNIKLVFKTYLMEENLGLQDFKQSKKLCLHSRGLKDSDIKQLMEQYAKSVQNNKETKLEIIDLNSNQITAIGIKYLVDGPFWNLLQINLYRNKIDSKGAEYLSKGPFQNLKNLNLDQNMIGEEGAVHLSKGMFKQLSYIGLNGNQIGDNGIKHISQGSLLNLTIMHLNRNSISNQGIKHLATGSFQNLTSLHLGFNKIGNEGAKHISNGLFKALTHLYLFNNFIGYEGVNHLSNGLFHVLKLLILMNNKIGTEATKIIINGSLKKSLRTVILSKNNIFKEAKDNAFSLGLTNNQEEIIQIRV